MQSASGPSGEPVVTRVFCFSTGLHGISFVRARTGTFSELAFAGKTEVPRMQPSSETE